MKTVSLELAKQLKKNGFPQEANYFWGEDGNGARLVSGKTYPDTFNVRDNPKPKFYCAIDGGDDIHETGILGAAPTADEILDKLPKSIEYLGKICYLHIDAQYERWYVHYADELHFTGKKDENLTDLLSRLWLYLKKEKLI